MKIRELALVFLSLFVVCGSASAAAEFFKTRDVSGKLADRQHGIYAAECNADERVIGGSCQCHASSTWLAGMRGNGWQCACEKNPEHTSATARCLSVPKFE